MTHLCFILLLIKLIQVSIEIKYINNILDKLYCLG